MEFIVYISAIVFSVVTLTFLATRKWKLLKRDEKLQAELAAKEARTAKEEMKKELHKIEVSHTRKHKSDAVKKSSKKGKKIPKIVQVQRAADAAFENNDLVEAKKGFIQVLSLQEDHDAAMNKLAIIYLKEENYPKAELLLKKLIHTFDNAIYYSNLGLVLYHQNKLHEAIVAYEKAIEIDGKRAQRYISLSHIYYELENIEKAFECLVKAHKKDPKNVELLFEIVAFAERQNDIRSQEKYLKVILNKDPYNEEAKRMLGKLSATAQVVE